MRRFAIILMACIVAIAAVASISDAQYSPAGGIGIGVACGGDLCGSFPNCHVCGSTYSPATTDAGVATSTVFQAQASTADGGTMGGFTFIVPQTPNWSGLPSPEGVFQVCQGDAGSGQCGLTVRQTNTSGGCWGIGLAQATNGSATDIINACFGSNLVTMNTPFQLNITYGFPGGNLMEEHRPDVFALIDVPEQVFKWTTGSAENPSLGVEKIPTSPVDRFIIFGGDSTQSGGDSVNGDGIWLAGGAASSNGDAGLRGSAGLCLGGGWNHAGHPRDCLNEIGVELSEPSLGHRVVVLGQIGHGTGPQPDGAAPPPSIVNGDGTTLFYPAVTDPTSAPDAGTQCWTSNADGKFKCWRAGGDAAVVMVP